MPAAKTVKKAKKRRKNKKKRSDAGKSRGPRRSKSTQSPLTDHQKAMGFVARTVAHWRTNLKIVDRRRRLIPLEANHQQRTLLYWSGRQIAAGLPVRIITLKARRMGISTAIQALAYTLADQVENFPAMTSAHDADSTQTLWEMTQTFRQEHPTDTKRPADYHSRRELVYTQPHRSSLRFQTAGGRELGRSKEIAFWHGSEIAFYPAAKTTETAVQQSVADHAETFIFKESTANGAGGEFYEEWNAAEKLQRADRGCKNLDRYIPLFFSWLDFPEYRREVPEGYVWGQQDEYEREIVELGASDEQLYWRRWAIDNKCGGDPETFAQEYPHTPQAAFRTSGRPAFPLSIIRRHEALVCDPTRRVVLSMGPAGEIHVSDADETDKFWWDVWHEPQEFSDYCVAGDVAEGRVSDPDDSQSDPDYSTGVVLNRVDMRIDATWRGQIDADLLGLELKAAKWYLNAWVTPEANAAGQAALLAIQRESAVNLYQRERPTDAVKEGEVPLYGWKTTTSTRGYLIATWMEYCRPDPAQGFSGKIEVYSEQFVSEERSFQVNKMGKREHAPRCHDDLLFAGMIALQLHLRCPRQIRSHFNYRTPDHAEARKQRGAAYVGGVDLELQELMSEDED